MNDIEASKQLEQALHNLPRNYPFLAEAFRAYGYLVLGKLGVLHPYHAIRIHKSGLQTLERVKD